MRRGALLALAVVLAVAAWPPIGLGALGFVVVAPLVAALEGLRPLRAFLVTWAQFGLAGGVVFRWLFHGLLEEYQVALGPSIAFVVVFVAVLSLGTALAAALWAGLGRRAGPLTAPLVFAALWTLSEWGRSVLLGVPWWLLAHTQARTPLFLQSAELLGAWGPGFVLAASGAGLGLAGARRSARPLWLPALLVLASAGYGALRMARPVEGGPPFRVAVVQASVAQAERFQPGSALRNTLEHAKLTRAVVAESAPDVVVWSETAVDDDLDARPELRRLLERLTDEIGAPLVTGAPRTRAGRPENAVLLFAPGGGIAESYAKQRLVPIAEGDAAWTGPLAPLVPEVARGEPYAPGDEATVFRAGPAPFSTPICFEVTYPDLMRGFRAAGAAWIVNLSNDAWFGPTGYPEMHLRHAVLRAVELRSWVVRGANTGISAAIDPHGRIVAEVPPFEDGSLVVEIFPTRGGTPHLRFGDVPALGLLVGGLALTAAAGRWHKGGGAPRERR